MKNNTDKPSKPINPEGNDMELYLDSVKLKEVEAVQKLGFVYGLTTTPTFLHRDGITDVDNTLVKLSKMVNILQVEALGDSAELIKDEAQRLVDLGLDKSKTVFKIPISMEGARACKLLVDDGFMVNLHLVYSLQQAYIAFSAGATYVCPLVGRLQDQGHDALGLIADCVEAVNHYGYASKVMFSSVRHPEHVKNALNLGAHACTIPWKVLQQLPNNHFTSIGTQQFEAHTFLMNKTVKEVIRPFRATISFEKTVLEALVLMTQSSLGAITVLGEQGNIHRIFTDGDLRRLLEVEREAVLQKKLSSLPSNTPTCIDQESTVYEASELFKTKKLDNIIVTRDGQPIGMIDIQDIQK